METNLCHVTSTYILLNLNKNNLLWFNKDAVLDCFLDIVDILTIESSLAFVKYPIVYEPEAI